MTPEVVATGIRFPEGPVWCPGSSDEGDALVCTSVADGAVERIDLHNGHVARLALVGGGANAALACTDGGFLVTQNGGIDFGSTNLYPDDPPPYRPVTPGIQRVSADGHVTYVTDVGYRAPNDLVVTADGSLWFTDPPPFPPSDDPVGRVHVLAPDGTRRVAADGFVYCNGIALEPDGTPVVVEGRGVVRLEPDGGRRWITETVGGQAGDGLCVDVDGRLYVANTAAHGVRVFEPSGVEVEFLAIPGRGVTTNCCFGGRDGRTLFATDGIPGQVVAWEGLPAPGLPLHPWPHPDTFAATAPAI
ncbi:MAG TPA: SMP-30/gluconolactonase/LRE family protein [Acidimicrobiia bacterium]|nr:SMP-30/gluconolactonase/LRE family protein [Acidimicrobiia bacterium]